jgi:hypothetical protein
MIINVNNTEIHCPQHEGQNYVDIKPICEILGIDFEKARIIKERRELEHRLNTNEDYARLQDLRIKESRISKPLHKMDCDTIAGQLNLFQD